MTTKDAKRVIELLEDIRDELRDGDDTKVDGVVSLDDSDQGWNERTGSWKVGNTDESVSGELAKNIMQIIDSHPMGFATAKMVDQYTDIEAHTAMSKLHRAGGLSRQKPFEKDVDLDVGPKAFCYELSEEGKEWLQDYKEYEKNHE